MKTATEFPYVSKPVTDLTDKIVLITGAGRGSGRALAEAFAERGACIAANDISPVNLDVVVNGILEQGGCARAYIEDVAKKVGAQHIVKLVEDDFGRIDILVNHASVEPHVPLLDMDEWDWHRVLDVNLTGAFLMTQSVGRVMRAQGQGVIINLIGRSEVSAERNAAAFLATMSGLEGLTKQAESELRPYGIQVHAVDVGIDPVVGRVLALFAE
jgi:NAD(P)-dependent dehydrogenase (short-subunit alcohol dehydrogenase family)